MELMIIGTYAFKALANHKKQRKTWINPAFSAKGIKGLEDIESWKEKRVAIDYENTQ
jgi:hypothetical protein